MQIITLTITSNTDIKESSRWNRNDENLLWTECVVLNVTFS